VVATHLVQYSEAFFPRLLGQIECTQCLFGGIREVRLSPQILGWKVKKKLASSIASMEI
jgi:hypothetical protein